MNKNLKKLISAVAALAISASSVAAFAASFPDVAETASYKQAVDELVALEIINGFEDGTFGPDQNVTRAQITKMIVTALGDTAVQAAEAAAGRDTQFADVTANHWAAGYVATGTSATASNFINGYSETSFGPEDNVTYAQAVKMLVAALGYNSYAENEGGWPNGYLKYGYSLGLTDGVSGVGNDDPATRAQVAQMIDNALKCPICVTDGYENDAWGRPVPRLVVKDGDNDYTKNSYQNLLNYAHDAYLVYGRVTGTFKGNTTGLEVGQVKFQIERSDNWLGYDVPRAEAVTSVPAYKGEVTNADDYLNVYAEAIIFEDENEEYTLISLTPYGTTEQITLETDLFRSKTADSTAKYDTLYMFKDYSKNKYDTYKIDHNIEIYVNGADSNVTGIANLEAYVSGNEGGSLVLIDKTDEGKSTADGIYDVAMVTLYAHTVVDYVEIDEDEAVIYFESSSNSAVDEFTIDFEDEDVEYNLTLNGEAITVEELQQYDVLSIAANNVDFSKATTFDVIVSRDTVEGQLRTTDTTDGEYTFDNGETYKLAWSTAAQLENGVSYTLYLNAFGKVTFAEELASAKKYAVVHNVYETTGSDEYYAVVITAEGKVTYLLKDKAAADILADVVAPGKTVDTLDGATKAAVQNRVIEYSINTKGELIAKNQVKTGAEYRVKGTKIEGDFKASKGKLGSEYVSEAITTFVDLEEYCSTDKDTNKQDYTKAPSAMTYASLVDGTKYTAYAFGEVGTDDIAQFVVITSGMGGLNVNSPMAIYVSGGQQSIDGQDVEAITAYVNGELTTLIDDDATYNMNAGDAFFYTLDSDGYIEDLETVLTTTLDINDDKASTYDELYKAAITNKFDMVDADLAKRFAGTATTGNFSRPADVKTGCALVFGAIVDASNGDVSIATKIADENKFDVNDTVEYDITDDTVVYKYDYATHKAKNRVEKTAVAAFKYAIPKAAFDATNDDLLDFEDDTLLQNASNWTNANYGKVRLAVLKVVEDEVVEAIIYIPSTSKD